VRFTNGTPAACRQWTRKRSKVSLERRRAAFAEIFLWNKTMREAKVTYTLEMDGKFFIIENVPARVCEETGEQFFSPETVERLQQTILGTGEAEENDRDACL
jgi:YgiT-type zinc finger domain-containing protein